MTDLNLTAGSERNPEAVVRSNRVPAGPVQHWRPACPHHIYLRHHWDDYIWPCQASGIHYIQILHVPMKYSRFNLCTL